ncbi:hypothetical protein GCM10010269_34500 [Streptomyces humidus]|uniref:TerD domain-containing protein n=1 Tax=Streptomyces humidus TaxID=52259 RepID=A0A918L4A5_9ACTN|nr:hypothetical protein GCM10010269_34500 [Streptomyces humidus]
MGVAIHQNTGPKTFGDLSNAGVLVVVGYAELLKNDFAKLAGATAGTVAEFVRDASGTWEFHEMVRGFGSEPIVFGTEMGSAPRP